METLDEKIQELADYLQGAERITVLTGAGISTESDIPDFRSNDGIYRTITSEEIFNIRSFREDPDRFYSVIAPIYRKIQRAEPNAGHRALAELEKRVGKTVEIVTQNIDSLHSRAGSTTVHEIHGTFATLTCLDCGTQANGDDFHDELENGRPLRCPCGGVLKPDITFFGEELPYAPFVAAQRAMWNARLLLILGTSLAVHPAAALPRECDSGIPIVIINKTPTWLDRQADLVFHAPIGEILPKAVAKL